MAVLLLAACDDDPTTPGNQIICPTPAPNLAGTWSGALQNQQISITLTERCVAYLFGARYWEVGGQWSWSGHQGNAAGLTGANPELHLRMGAPPQPTSFVLVRMTAPVPVAASAINGFASGVWRLPTDTTRVVASFDSVAVTLQRN